ncbi:MAG: peptide/nickel transport system substrate-binding protein [Gammaproteobacteria bacterium]|jgi:peptide/nickel transport system substrate-binding protein
MNDADLLLSQLRDRKISRRTFIGRMAALSATGVISLPMTSSALATTPVKGGHMRFAMGHGSTTDSLDPGKVLNGFLSSTHYAITNTLTEVDAHGVLVPKLAESWGASADAAQWSFKLRKGVEFHDGKSLNAKDIIASINHHRGDKSKSSAKTIVDPITEIAIDGDRINFVLSSGDADFPFKLSSFNFPIYQANSDGSLNWDSHVGVGGYVLKDFEPGVRATFERNPNYWQDDRAHFASAELLVVSDPTARQTALTTGAVDAIDRVDLKTASLLKKVPGIVLEEVTSKTHYTFPMNTTVGPLNDRNVRMALKLAFDREEMLNKILHGYGSIGNDQPISSAYPYFNAELKQRAYDPEKAKFYLKKAGLTKLDIELSAADAAFPGSVDAAVLFGAHAKKAGISIKVKREPNDGYWSNVWMKKPFVACYWPGYPTVDSILTQAYAAGGSWNDTFWDHAKFNNLLTTARSELDTSRRGQMYGEMQQILSDEGGVILPFFANDVFATSDKIGHGDLSSNYEIDGRMYLERWWFKKA